MKPQKILILSERFYPEEFLINDLASEWQKQGFSVEVLTQVPSYPHDAIMDGYRNKLLQTTQELQNIPVHRVRTVLGYNKSVKRKILNYISFAFFTSIWALCRGWKYDRVFTFHSGPLTMATAGLILHFLWRKKCMIWTQDVWPDSVYNYGIKKTPVAEFFLNTIVRVIYSAYSRIFVSCPGFIDRLKPFTKKEVCFLPQWTTLNQILPEKKDADKLVFTFAGNIGSVQNLEMVVEVFGKLNAKNAWLYIVGGGVYWERLQELVSANHYENIVLTGRRPMEEMPSFFEKSDFLIISLKSEFNLTVPAKFQAYIAAGRPILGLVDGDTKLMIERYQLGITGTPSDTQSIKTAFERCLKSTVQERRSWRQNAIRLSDEKFAKNTVIQQFTDVLKN